MKTTLHARRLELDPGLKDRVTRKLHRLDRVTDPDAQATVELTASASKAADTAFRAEVIVTTSGTTIRSVAEGATPMAAVDALIDQLERQVVRAKQRVRAGRRVNGARGESSARSGGPGGGGRAEPAEAGGNGRAGVVEITRLDMVPMFPEDAIAQMEDLGQAFFVFVNAQTGRVNVVYRRAAGGHGLIDPVVA